MLERLRKTSTITKEELTADGIFFALSFVITEIAVFIFDIHWNFYPGGQLFPPAKHIFADQNVYLYSGMIGSIAGFFMIKVLLFGIRQEEKIWKATSSEAGAR